jgi:hypothetical protein
VTRRPTLTPFAKAQAFGLALGFASALWNTSNLGFGLGLFAIGAAGAWIGWEFLFGKSAPSARSDIRALTYAFLTGFIFPWIGFALAALAALARP